MTLVGESPVSTGALASSGLRLLVTIHHVVTSLVVLALGLVFFIPANVIGFPVDKPLVHSGIIISGILTSFLLTIITWAVRGILKSDVSLRARSLAIGILWVPSIAILTLHAEAWVRTIMEIIN